MGEATRRLAGILVADVVGYSTMMAADEASTMARVRALRSDVIEPLAAEHQGRIFKTTGDGFLAEFASAVQALRCAIAVQEKLNAQADGLRLRIGVHQGEVVQEGDDLLGSGVIVASRIEPLADPGGICISGRVREDAAGKVSLAVEDLGTPLLKNISQPVQVLRVRLGGVERPALPLPDKPSIAVLPFANMSSDPEQEYFSDGVVEDVITALSRVGWLFVIARNSSFAYKGTSPDIRRVGRELGVRYVLEGSIRRAGARVRITAQLIEAATGGHVWAGRFEENSTDLFELQDRITESVVAALEPNIEKAEIARATSKPTESLDAYDLYLRALHQPFLISETSNAEARRLLKLAVAKDERFGLAKAAFAHRVQIAISRGWTIWDGPEMLKGIVAARAAIAISPDDPITLALAGFAVARMGHDLDAARTALNRAVALNPNSAMVLGFSGWLRNLLGEFSEARDAFTRAIRLSPLDVNLGVYRSGLAMALTFGKPPQLEEALELCRYVLEGAPTLFPALQCHIEILVSQGKVVEAREAARRLMSLYPSSSISAWRRRWPHRPEVIEKMTALYRTAGIPE